MYASVQPLLLEEVGARRQEECWELSQQGALGWREEGGLKGIQKVDRKADLLTECQLAVPKLGPDLRAQKKAGLHSFSLNICCAILTVCQCSVWTDECFTLTEETEAHRQAVSHPSSHSAAD